jgi:hypothetical protein
MPFFTNLGPNIARAAGRAFDWFINLFRDAWAGVTNWWNNTVIPFFRNLPGNVARLAGAIWNFLGDFLRNAWTGVTNWWNNTVIPWFTGLPGRIANAAAGLWDFFRNGFRDALNFIIRRWNAFRIDARFPPDFIVPFLRNVGFTLETPNIPELAAGGVVRATPGGIAAIIGEGGRNERVEPLDKDGLSVRDRAIIAQLSGSGGATINVYPSAGMNERELADLVSRRLAFELRRGAA